MWHHDHMRRVAIPGYPNLFAQKFSHKAQPARLCAADYPLQLPTAVAGSMLRKNKTDSPGAALQPCRSKNVVVVPCLHGVGRCLGGIAGGVGVDVVFTAPQELSSLCAGVNGPGREHGACDQGYRERFAVPCVEGVVCCIALSCGRGCLGQTGGCLNDRLESTQTVLANLQ